MANRSETSIWRVSLAGALILALVGVLGTVVYFAAINPRPGMIALPEPAAPPAATPAEPPAAPAVAAAPKPPERVVAPAPAPEPARVEEEEKPRAKARDEGAREHRGDEDGDVRRDRPREEAIVIDRSVASPEGKAPDLAGRVVGAYPDEDRVLVVLRTAGPPEEAISESIVYLAPDTARSYGPEAARKPLPHAGEMAYIWLKDATRDEARRVYLVRPPRRDR